MSGLRPTNSLIGGYPKSITLAHGGTVLVRPLQATDQAGLLSFFRGMPADDRWWLREDVGDPAVIRRWIADLDYERVLPLVAIADGVIVADATLHRRGFGARQNLAEVRMAVAPSYRGRGLAHALLGELAEIAQAAGLARLEAEIVARAQTGALEAVEQFGFTEVAVIQDHLISRAGELHDLIHLVYPLADA
jgi:GNAT superfamily N-acetyltransferase